MDAAWQGISHHLGLVLAVFGTHGAQLVVTSVIASMPPKKADSFWYAWFYDATHAYLNLKGDPIPPAKPVTP